MEVTTELTRADLIKFNLAVIPSMKSTYVVILFIAVFLFYIVVSKHGFPESIRKWIFLVMICVSAGVLATIFTTIISFIPILITSRVSNGVLGKHAYKLTEEGLYEKTAVNTGLAKWEGFMEVKVTGSFVFFRMSAYLFHIIPKRSFSSNESFQSFSYLAQSYWQKSKLT